MSGAVLRGMQLGIVLLAGVAGAGVVRTRDPTAQAVALSFYGMVLALMFFLYRAPDVALSQIVIGTMALPLMVLLALARIRRNEEQRRRKEEQGKEQGS